MVDSTALIPTPHPLGSMPLRNPRHETYARCRALNMPPRASAVEAGLKRENGAVTKLERNTNVQARIAWIGQQPIEVLRSKREHIEKKLWLWLEANQADLWETVERIDPKTKEARKYSRPKPISDLPLELQQAIESISINENGHAVAKLVSPMHASIELRRMLGLSADTRSDVDDEFSRLPQADLLSSIERLARELGKYEALGEILATAAAP